MSEAPGHGTRRPDAPLDCATARAQLFEFLDGELGPEREGSLRAHLERCAHCFAEAGFARRFLELVQASRSAETCPDALRARVREALRREGWAGTVDS